MPAPLQVLIVEDNPLDAELVLRELHRAGFAPEWRRVETETDFLVALDEPLDIVLSDFELPQFNGLRALELMQQRGRELPFILISGTIGEDLAVTAMQRGVSDYLMKDRLGRLGPAIGRAMNQKRLERETRRANQALLDNAAFVHDVLDSLSAAVVVIDDEGRITATNASWRRFAEESGAPTRNGENYAADSLVGPAALVEADARAARAGIGAVLRGERGEFIMEYASRASATPRWFLMRVTPLTGAGHGAVVAHEQITELKLAELSVRESEERFRRLIENASDMIIVVNEAGEVEFISPSAKRALDYGPEDVVGRPVKDFIHEDDYEAAAAALSRVLTEPESTRAAEYRLRHRDGTWRIFQSRGKSMRGTKGEALIVINSRDVTETRKLEEQFLRAQRLEAIGTLSAGIAHDLNNILAPMLMVAPLLREKLPAPEDAELLTMIEQAAQRGAGIIKQLLTFSRGVEGKRLPVQTRYLLKDMMTIMRETFPREIALREQVPADLWPVIADATQIHQVLLNLCVNARDAMHGGGTLTVTAQNLILDEAEAAVHEPLRPGAYVALGITDTGEGISRENLNRIFEPFFTTKELGKGTGLGLSTVLGIVKSHDGIVEVSSEVGRGTTFQVFLPAMEGAREAAREAVPATWRGDRQIVLVVDDEAPIRRALRLMLEDAGYVVLEAGDGQAALEVLVDQPDTVQLLLTDVMMPRMNGIALARAARSLAPQLPIIATSGLQDESRTEELVALGVGHVIAKPCSAAEVLEALHRALTAAARKA